ncbi:hypothetical protein HC776_01900 [bacterium]|nr:hypothetical protein [bacterium]
MNMCINDGVPRLMLLSTAAAPCCPAITCAPSAKPRRISPALVVESQVIRAPLLYERGTPRPLLYRLFGIMRFLPLLAQLGGRQVAPLPLDVFVRGVARLALQSALTKRVYYASDLRRLNSREERRGLVPLTLEPVETPTPLVPPEPVSTDQTPFGWTPPPSPPRRR